MTLDNQHEERVRGAFAALTDAVPLGVEFDELNDVRSTSQARAVASPDRRRGWLVALVSAVAVLVLVGGVAWLVPSPGPETPIAATPPSVSSTSLSWSRVPYSEEVFGGGFEQSMSGVTVGSFGLVAVGGIDQRAAVWTSPDGIEWSRVSHDDAVFGGEVGPSSGGSFMEDVTAGGPGLVAVGQAEPNAAVWTSVDGITWSRVPHDEAIFGGEVGLVFGGANMNSVTVGGPGLVAVGFDGSPDGGGVAAVWTSVDGIRWSRVPHDDVVFGGDNDGYYGQEMLSVTAGGPGLVAVGSDVGRAAVWTSVDGITWSRVLDDKAVFAESGMNDVAVGGPGLVAVGQADNTAAVWTSTDGVAWSRVPHDEAVFGGGTDLDWDVAISSVTAVVDGLVAVGSDPDREGVAVWTSVDGLTWSRAPRDEAAFGVTADRPHMHMTAVTAGGPGFVAVGAHSVRPTSGPTDGDAAVWVAVHRK
jgi:hypothetical protein